MNAEKRIVRPWLALLLLPLVVSSCGGLLRSGEPARQVYLLMPARESGGGASTAPGLSLSVSAVPGLDTDRILVLEPDARLNHYANARWPDHLPEVLGSVIGRSLEASGRFASVDVSERATAGGWLVRLEVRQFYGIQNAEGETTAVRAELAGSIDCGDRSEAVDLTESAAVSGQRLSAVVAAHQAALDGVTRKLLDTIVRSCPES